MPPHKLFENAFDALPKVFDTHDLERKMLEQSGREVFVADFLDFIVRSDESEDAFRSYSRNLSAYIRDHLPVERHADETQDSTNLRGRRSENALWQKQ